MLPFRALVSSTAAVVLLSGCSIRLLDFTTISSKNVSLDPFERTNKRVSGMHCVPVILLPFGAPNLKQALDQAIERAGPPFNALVDGVIQKREQNFLVGRSCVEVTGTPIALTKSANGSSSSTGHTLPANAILYHSSVVDRSALVEQAPLHVR